MPLQNLIRTFLSFFLLYALFSACSENGQRDSFSTFEPESVDDLEGKSQRHSPELVTETIVIDGVTRTYLMFSPVSVGYPLPVIIDFHGGSGTAAGQYVTSNFEEIAQSEGIVVIYPQANVSTGSVWNTLHSDEGNKVADVDDFSFISVIIESLYSNSNIDTSRIYVSGYSNGAAMAYQIACHLNSRIAGFVVMSGLFPLEVQYPCDIRHETPGIIINGTADYERPMAGIEGYALPVRDAASWWATQNGSTQESIIEEDNIERTIYDTPNSTQIQLFVVEGGGHDWFNFTVDGMPMNTFIWDFLSDYEVTVNVE